MNREGICLYLGKQLSLMEINLPPNLPSASDADAGAASAGLPSDRLLQALEQNPLAMVITNLKGEICYANKAMLKMGGYALDEVVGKSTKIFQSGQTPVHVYKSLWSTLKRGENWRQEWVDKKSDGTLYWEEIFISPIRDDSGEISYYLAVKQDISLRKRAEQDILGQKLSLEQRIEERNAQLSETNLSLRREIEERLETEKTLRATTLELESFFNLTPDLLLIADFSGKVIKANSAWESVLGYPVALFEQQPVLEFVHPDDVASTLEKMTVIVQGMNAHPDRFVSYGFVNRYRSSDGGYRYLEWNIAPSGNYFYGAARDITERRMAEQVERELLNLSPGLTGLALSEIDTALQMALERVGLLLDADRAYIFAFGPQQLTMTNTHEWCSPGTSSEMPNLQQMPTDAIPRWMEAIRKQEILYLPDVNLLPEDWGYERAILEAQDVKSLLVFPLYIEGRLMGFVGLDSIRRPNAFGFSAVSSLKVWADMLAGILNNRFREALLEETRQQSMSQLKLSEEKFARAFHTGAVMMSISDFETGEYIDLNQTFLDVLGYDSSEVIGNTNVRLGIFENRGVMADLKEKIDTRIPVRRMEVTFRTRKGEIKTGLVSADEIFVGQRRCILIVTVDISDRKRAEEALTLARIEADKANSAKSQFLSRISHELRTPLNSILGFAQLLQMGGLTPGQEKGVTHIMRSGKHLLSLINEVLDISRIESGRLALSIEPVQLNSLIAELLESIMPLAAQRNIVPRLLPSESDTLSVRADKQRLKQVLINLLNNAIKYNREGGELLVFTELKESELHAQPHVRISVQDSGKGILPHHLSKLFSPFERIGAEKSQTEGTGLGLSLVKQLVEAMGGQVGVQSHYGEGSTFWVEFPRVVSHLSQAQQVVKASGSGFDRSSIVGSILYIEDNLSNVDLVELILRSLRPGVTLRSHAYGKDALQLALEDKPNLILLDLNLPDMHGSEVLLQLKQHPETQNIPVAIITADASPSLMRSLLKAGALVYLTKPLEIPALLKLIDENIVRLDAGD